MKKTQQKDALRNISKQKVSYLSIVVIAMLAVMAYLGINFASAAIANNGNEFYGATDFRDVEVISTKLLTEDDMSAIRALEGVTEAEGVWQTDGVVIAGEGHKNADVVSLTEHVNVPMVLEGRLPERTDECALEQELAEELGIKPGDVISVQDPGGGNAQYLLGSEFTVTGIVFHPDHASWTLMIPGNRDVIVLPGAFDREALDGCCMKAVILLNGGVHPDRFAKDYLASLELPMERLEALGEERALIRDAGINERYGSEIEENQKKLDEAEETLRDARRQLDEAEAEYEENMQKLDDAEKELAESRDKLESGQKELSDAKAQLDRSRPQLESAAAQLAEGKAVLDEKQAEIDEAREKLEAAEKELAEGKEKLDDGEKQLAEAKEEIESASLQISAGQSRLSSAEKQLREAHAEIEARKTEIRNTIRDAMISAITAAGVSPDKASGAVGMINWASGDPSANMADPSLSATRFQITDSIGIDLSQVDFSATAGSAMARFDSLFDLAVAKLQDLGVETAELVAKKEEVRTEVQTRLDTAAELEASYNAIVS
ncbi:MAG: hypothetical protein II689_01910, partial [Firmicutes bacterium]|nr:hypothetical protein [Bacillota bacterium]